jgi:hypothetical protein
MGRNDMKNFLKQLSGMALAGMLSVNVFAADAPPVQLDTTAPEPEAALTADQTQPISMTPGGGASTSGSVGGSVGTTPDKTDTAAH